MTKNKDNHTIIDRLLKKLELLEKEGRQGSEEYEDLCEEYMALATDEVVANLLPEDSDDSPT